MLNNENFDCIKDIPLCKSGKVWYGEQAGPDQMLWSGVHSDAVTTLRKLFFYDFEQI